jgi:cytochrome oxidase Cu insertion factor (SCO1/SenC/PrrC family)
VQTATGVRTLTAKTRRLAPFYALVALFALPVVAAWAMWFVPELRPDSQMQKGLLLDPPIGLERLDLHTPAGVPIPTSRFERRWVLLTYGGQSCAGACRRRVEEMHKVRLALGKARQRVSQLLVLESIDEAPGMHALTAAFRDLTVARGRQRTDAGGVFIVDPFGDLILSYPPQAPPQDVLNDMKRLVRVSRI